MTTSLKSNKRKAIIPGFQKVVVHGEEIMQDIIYVKIDWWLVKIIVMRWESKNGLKGLMSDFAILEQQTLKKMNKNILMRTQNKRMT